MEEDSYSVSKSLQSNVNPAHLDFSDDNARHKKGKDRLSNHSFLSNACDISNQYLAPGIDINTLNIELAVSTFVKL